MAAAVELSLFRQQARSPSQLLFRKTRIVSRTNNNIRFRISSVMTVSVRFRMLKQSIRKYLLWQYLRHLARRENIDSADLGRIKVYLDSKFGLKNFPTGHPSQRTSGYFPGLSLTKVYEPQQFEWVRRLEENAPAFVYHRNASPNSPTR